MRQKRRTRDRTKVPNDPMPKITVIPGTKRAINPDIVARSRAKPAAIENAFTIPSFPPHALPPGTKASKHPMAMDAAIIEVNAWAAQNLYAGAFNNGATFLGYPYLSQLAQVPEYRKISETIAMHMTRKFITLQAAGEAGEGDDSKTQKIKEITDDLENFGVRDVFRRAAEVDGYFGRAHLYIDLGYQDDKELKMPIGDGRNALSRIKIEKGSLKGFKIIEPVWTYPGNYNSNNPMTMDWYNPQTWFVMQKEIHVSRCIRMVGREVPDLLKPAYSFGGLSLSQMAKPYVDNWLRTRQSVADLIWSFSVSGVMTDLQTLMAADGGALFDRAELFNNLRNNRGMMLLNKDSEEFFQVNTPLGTLDKLQAQAQEHMASVSSIPLVFLLGITPSGLNASSEGEIRAFYDFIHAFQMKFFTDPLKRVIDFIQLNRYGEVDPEITFIYEPLWSMTEKEQAEVDKTHAETDDLRINGGVISPLEARKRVANAPDTPYAGLDITVIPVPPGSSDTDGDGEPDPDGAPPIGGEELDPGANKDVDKGSLHDKWDKDGGPSFDEAPFAFDDFKESDHPRGQPGNAGQFGVSGAKVTAAPRPVYTAHHGYGGGVVKKNGMGHRRFSDSEHGGSAKEAIEDYTKTMNEAPDSDHDRILREHHVNNLKMNFARKDFGIGQKFEDFSPEDQDKLANLEEIETEFTGMNLRPGKKSPLVKQGVISPVDGAIISAYTSSSWKTLNKSLRKGKLDQHANEFATNLNNALSKLPKFEGTTHRIVKFGPKDMEKLQPGATMTDKGFFSTSKDSDMQTQKIKGNVTMEIHGTNGRDVSTLSHSEHEQEILYPANSRFEVVSRQDTPDGKTHVIMREVPSQGQAHDEWQESKHPRGQPGNAGQFGSGGGSSGVAHEVVKKINAALNKSVGISGKYRQGLQALLKEPGITKEMSNKIKHKLVESYEAKAKQLYKMGDHDKSAQVLNKAVKIKKTLGIVAPKAESNTIQLTDQFGKEVPPDDVEDYFEPQEESPKDKPTPEEKWLDSMEDIDKPTSEELKKAMKATTVPNYQDSKVITEFNKKWANKAPANETEAAEKVNDYKEMKKKSDAEVKEKKDKVAAELDAEHEKLVAKLKEQAKAEAAALAAEMNDPDIAKHYQALKGVSIGMSDHNRKVYNSMIKKAGLEGVINAVDAGLIHAYTGGHYQDVNNQLRNGSLTKEQFNYAKSLNNALMKLPKYVGTVKRGTSLTPEVFKKYKPGYIVPERAFTSTGKGYKFDGSHTYEIESISGRDVQALSGHPSENEVIFPANSHFEVISVTGNHIKLRQVED